MCAGKINKLASDKQYDRYLRSQPTAEDDVEEVLDEDEITTEDMPPEDVDALFMERM